MSTDPTTPSTDGDASPVDSASWLQGRRFAFALLGIATALVLFPAFFDWGEAGVHVGGYLSPFSPLGDDASSHITTISSFARLLSEGEGWWSTDYNMGFPLVLYYQPLPHLVSSIFCLLFGGPDAATFTFKFFMILAMAGQPWAIYLGMRRAGFDRLAAALAGVMAPMILDGISFGYHSYASLKVGLYTQAWGNVALPLAIGELAAVIDRRGRLWVAMLACALVASCHMFYAIALVPPVLAYALSRPGRPTTLLHLGIVGGGAGALLAPWMVPLSLNQAFFGGWPFGRETRANGYGWSTIWNDHIKNGHILDAANGERWPILLLLAVVGAAWLLWRSRREPHARLPLILTVWALLGTIGRGVADSPGLGDWIDLYPLHESVQLFRYGSLLQFALLIAAGYGLSRLALLAARQSYAFVAPVVIVAALVFPARFGVEQLGVGFRTLDDSSHFTPGTYDELVGWLRDEPMGGRMYVGPKSEVRGHYHSGLLAYRARRPAAQSYGVGLHDSLHFYTLEYFDPQRATALSLANIYDFRLLVSRRDFALRGLGDREVIEQNGRYVLSRLPVDNESVAIMRVAGTIDGTPRGEREAIRRWLNGNGAATGTTLQLRVTDPHSRDHLVGSPRSVPERTTFEYGEPPSGRVLSSQHDDDEVITQVDLDEDAWIMAKVGYHPFWRAWVDGVEAEVAFLFPGMPGVQVPEGAHSVRFVFAWPGYTRFLMLLMPFPLLLAWGWERRRATHS